MSEQSILKTIRYEGPISRADLSRLTGLSKPTVSSFVEDLIQLNLVAESGPHNMGNLGRPPTLLSLNESAWYVGAVDLGGTQQRIRIANAAGETLSTIRVKTYASGSPEDIAGRLHSEFLVAVDKAGIESKDVWVLFVGMPGVVDPINGTIRLIPNLPKLEDSDFPLILTEKFDCATYIENDVNLAAVGEHSFVKVGSQSNSVFVAIGTGLGIGVIVQDRLLRGTSGRAGEVGYVPFKDGIIEDYVSGAGLARNYFNRTHRSLSAKEVFALHTRDRSAKEVVEEFFEGLAWLLAVISLSFDPELIILGGGIGLHLPFSLEALMERISAICPSPAPIQLSQLSDDATLAGGVAQGLLHTTKEAVELARQRAEWGKHISLLESIKDR